MPYTAPTPSTVVAGDTFPATAYNIIAGDIADHETRIKTGVESYTTAQKNGLTGVTAGTLIYDSTLGLLQVWNGSIWITATSAQVPIASSTATNVSNIDLDNVFTSTFPHYKVIVTLDAMTNVTREIQIRFRTGGISNSTANYGTTLDQLSDSGLTAPTRSSYGNITSYIFVTRADSSNGGAVANGLVAFEMSVLNPQVAQRTFVNGFASGIDSNFRQGWFGGLFNATTQFDGLSIISSSGNIAVKVQVYGVLNV